MNTKNYPTEDYAVAKSASRARNYRFSFSSFLQAIKDNSELRRHIGDIVDLGLYEYAIRRNTAFINSVRAKAEDESIEIMMRFANGANDFQTMKRVIHQNRIIRTLAKRDRYAQMELLNKFNQQALEA